jgi:hypothetical protein
LALGRIGPGARAAAPVLRKIAQNGHEQVDVRRDPAEALRQFDPDAAAER